MLKWKRSGDMFSYKDEEIHAILSYTEEWTTVKDRDVPDYDEVVDDELLADGIERLMKMHHENTKAWEQWNRQGWWPRPVKKEMFQLLIMFKDGARTHSFKGTIDTSANRKAMQEAEKAIEKIRNRKYPRWMEKISSKLEARVAAIYLLGKR